MKGYTVYAKNSGLEIRASQKVSENTKEGRINLRFFTFGNDDSKSLKFILTPVEAYDLYLKTANIAKNGGRQTLTHQFGSEDSEIITTLTIEKWEREDRSGYAYGLKRGETKINVPMDMAHFLFVGELLKYLSTEQAWTSYKAETEDAVDIAEDEPSDEPTALTESGDSAVDEDEPAEETAPPTPAEKPASTGNGNTLIATIEAVRKDRKAIKVGDQWYEISERTKIDAELVKGKKVKLYFSKGEKKSFANAIYPVEK